MYYGSYKSIRNSAWHCLIDFKIDRLPIDVLKIAKTADIKVIRNSLVNDLLPNENGKSYFDGSDWIIIYDDTKPTVVSRFTVAHELGHIFLGHEIKHTKYSEANEFRKKPRSEQEADMFAMRILCPACVIWGLGLTDADEISRHCRVPLELSRLRATRMKELYERNKFLHSKTEQTVYDQFEAYINEMKSKEVEL